MCVLSTMPRTEVAIFRSMILLYFCFLVSAFRPCQGSFLQKFKRKRESRTIVTRVGRPSEKRRRKPAQPH